MPEHGDNRNNTTTSEPLSTSYSADSIERKWYQIWKERGYFSSEINLSGKPFSIVMPPPNVTGQLHIGHALDNTMPDILSRFRRMQGRRTFWLPGTDHAGIATQAKVEESLAAEGLSKYDIGREKFLEHTWQWKDKYHDRIAHQLEMLGCSCDWDKERFTLDEGCSEAVQKVFIDLFNKGLIYRGNYIVNWCSHCQTTISDIEVEHNPKKGHLWHLRYPFADGSGYITVATSRPETILGDTGVAVNPEDKRYVGLIGKNLLLPILNREIPLVADDYVDADYGTGAVKVTPAHDPNDFEMGLRHNLPQITVIGRDGKMTEEAGEFAGLDRYACREAIVARFKELGLFDRIEEIDHAVGECYRCGTVVEPLVSPQWFVKMKPLAEPAIAAVRDGDIKFVPDRFAKIYMGWMENIRDWCISRQLWWGHRIPVWYCDGCGEIICQKDEPAYCPKCGSDKLIRDPDVLDTWFSSALWPFSTMGWPKETQLLQDFYPTSVLVTGRDIIFFWVARMIFSALEFMDERPFDDVLIHGLVLDAQGRKMSKSLGNGIDPIEIINRYGADTLRFMFITGNTPGNDLRFQEDRLEASRNFINKIWNASRFVFMNLENYQPNQYEAELILADKWLLDRLSKTAAEATACLEKYELGEAGRILYDFFWDEFCDWYVEIAKERLYRGTPTERYTAQKILVTALKAGLQLLHPFIPFITEELWQHLPEVGESIMLAEYPDGSKIAAYDKESGEMSLIMDVIRAIRNIRSEMGVAPGKKAEIIIFAAENNAAVLKEGIAYISSLAQASAVEILPAGEPPAQSASAHVKGIDIFVPLKDLIDIGKEIARLEKEMNNCDMEIARISTKLANEGFLAKAPQEVVDKERVKIDEYAVKKAALAKRLLVFND